MLRKLLLLACCPGCLLLLLLLLLLYRQLTDVRAAHLAPLTGAATADGTKLERTSNPRPTKIKVERAQPRRAGDQKTARARGRITDRLDPLRGAVPPSARLRSPSPVETSYSAGTFSRPISNQPTNATHKQLTNQLILADGAGEM